MRQERVKQNILTLYITILSWGLRIFFHLLYHEFSWTYDAVAWLVSAGHWLEWVDQTKSYLRGKRVLEIGFGPGHLIHDLAAKGYEVVGIDRSPQMCHRLQRWILKIRNHNQLNGYAKLPGIILGSGVEIPLFTHSIDTIIATFPTEYIFHEKTAEECFRVLRDGGLLILLLSVHITGKTLAEKASGLLFRISGQEGTLTDAWLAPYRNAGFKVERKIVELGHSQVTLLLGEKLTVD